MINFFYNFVCSMNLPLVTCQVFHCSSMCSVESFGRHHHFDTKAPGQYQGSHLSQRMCTLFFLRDYLNMGIQFICISATDLDMYPAPCAASCAGSFLVNNHFKHGCAWTDSFGCLQFDALNPQCLHSSSYILIYE